MYRTLHIHSMALEVERRNPDRGCTRLTGRARALRASDRNSHGVGGLFVFESLQSGPQAARHEALRRDFFRLCELWGTTVGFVSNRVFRVWVSVLSLRLRVVYRYTCRE